MAESAAALHRRQGGEATPDPGGQHFATRPSSTCNPSIHPGKGTLRPARLAFAKTVKTVRRRDDPAL